MSTARDGVDVLVPATNDLPWIGMLTRSGYRQFLEAGVRIFEYGGPMIHDKTVVADGWWSKVGSTNLNFSSLAANWEIDLVAENKRFGAKMEEMFEEDLAHARETGLDSEELNLLLLHREQRLAGHFGGRPRLSGEAGSGSSRAHSSSLRSEGYGRWVRSIMAFRISANDNPDRSLPVTHVPADLRLQNSF